MAREDHMTGKYYYFHCGCGRRMSKHAIRCGTCIKESIAKSHAETAAIVAPVARHDEPRIVAECWTCKPDRIFLLGSADYQQARMRADEADKHRAAGHDVRPVTE